MRDGHTASLNLYFDASSTASVGEYVMKVPLTDGSGTQYMYLSLEVVPDSAGTTVGNAVSFVYVLGFATFEVTHYDNNTAWGKVVSDLVDDPSELTGGSAVRLVGWNQ